MSAYLESLFSLKGRVAAIIGGGGYLCGEIARGYLGADATVVILDYNDEKRVKAAEELRKVGGRVFETFIDVTKKQSHVAALEYITKNVGPVDILLNGAGINAPTPFFDISEEEFESIMASQIKGTLFGCQVFGRHMVERGRGVILNFSSASAGPPLSKAFTYSVAKAGIKNLTQNLAREWAKQGVRVNAFRPGFFPTEWSMKHFIDQSRQDAILGHTPMGRFGKPAELVGAAIWAASDAASFVTGTEIVVDGGFSCMTI